MKTRGFVMKMTGDKSVERNGVKRQNMKEQFLEKISHLKKSYCSLPNQSKQKTENILKKGEQAKTASKKSLGRRRKRNDIEQFGDKRKLLKPISDKKTIKMVTHGELFDIIDSAHRECGHGSADRTVQALKKKYANITKECVNLYLNLCESCQAGSQPQKGLVSIASSSRDENSFEVPAGDDLSSCQDLSRDSFDMNPKKMKLTDPTPSENTEENKPLFDEEELLQKAFDLLQQCATEFDESYHFGNLVACKLRTLDEYTRCAIQTDIMNLFLRANVGYYNRTEESTRRTCPPSTANIYDSHCNERPITMVSPTQGQSLFAGPPALTEDSRLMKKGPVTPTEDPRTLTGDRATLTAGSATLPGGPPILKEVPPILKEVPPILKEVPPILREDPPILKEVLCTRTGDPLPLTGSPAPLTVGPAPLTVGPAPLTGGSVPVTGGPAPLTGGSVPVTGGPAPLTVGPAPLTVGPAPLTGGPAPLTGGSVPVTGVSVPLTGGPAPLTGGPAPLTGGPAPLAGGPAPLTGGPAPLTGGPAPLTGGPAPLTGGPLTLKEVPPILKESPATLTEDPLNHFPKT